MGMTSKFWRKKIITLLALSLIFEACSSSAPKEAAKPSATAQVAAATGDLNQKIANRKNAAIPRGIDYTYPPGKIAFGSCADQDKPQPIWSTIQKDEPDLFIFDGDTIYSSTPDKQPMADQYIKLDQIPEYHKFREEIPMMAIWDDNDYGVNDGGRENPNKEMARRDFLSYWTYVRDSIALGQGPLYHAKIIGGPIYKRIERRGRRRSHKAKITSKPGSSVQVIMLDTRWNRTPLKAAEGNDPLKKYVPTDDPKATLLGTEQWTWLEDQLSKKADVKILVSTIQVIAEQQGFEKWANFPAERDRLFNLIKKSKAKNLFIISGDRHMGTIAKTDIPGWGTLYDITASGINRTSDIEENDPNYVGPVFHKENYGLATIDWQKKVITVQLKDVEGKVQNSVDIPLR